MVLALLVILGLVFGSFINALVWRVYEQSKKLKDKSKKSKVLNKQKNDLSTFNFDLSSDDLSILKGRSMCPQCRHELAAKDLIPLVSWLSLGGRCRYCKKPISIQYPLVELTMAAVFAFSYVYWPQSLTGAGQWVLFVTWLGSSVGLMALLVYDFKWMLLPNRILYPTFMVAITGRLAYILFYSTGKVHALELLVFSLLVAGGIFWLLYTVSKGRWIGYGDVRLGLITGTVLASPSLSFLMIFLASILGTLAVLPGLLTGRRNFSSKLPFGPFLISATFISLLFGNQLIDWYERLFLP